MKYYFIAEIRERQLMSTILSTYIASFEYLDKSLFISSNWQHFYCIICNCYWSACRNYESASCSLAFSITTGFVEKFLKTKRNRKKKHNKIVMLLRSKLNSIEGKISEVLINKEITHEDFMTILNKEKKYRELKDSKKIGINEIINNSLK